jgi:hypothetical protein
VALDPAFSEAFLHRLARNSEWSAHRVLGRRLRPFSLWHLLLLSEVESPLIQAAPIAAHDLVVGVELCRCVYPASTLGGRSLWRRILNAWHIAGGGLSRQVERFRAYREDFESPPDYSIVPPERSSGTTRGQPPLLFQLLVATIKVARCGRQEAWGVSPGEAAWYRAEWLKERGCDVDFIDAAVKAEQVKLEVIDPSLHQALLAGAAKFKAGIKGGHHA